jgi:hypothetical protein
MESPTLVTTRLFMAHDTPIRMFCAPTAPKRQLHVPLIITFLPLLHLTVVPPLLLLLLVAVSLLPFNLLPHFFY